jgi:hypothetical protein
MLDGISGALNITIQGINTTVIDTIKNFLHGAVHYWYKSHNAGEEFSFNTFMSDADDDCWQYTPLIALYNFYSSQFPSPPSGAVNQAMSEAAKKGGLILKSVLQEENREFKTVSTSPKKYTKV